MKVKGSPFVFALLQLSPLSIGVSAWTDFGLGRLTRRSIDRRATNSTPTPAPIVAGASQFWDGNDGPW